MFRNEEAINSLGSIILNIGTKILFTHAINFKQGKSGNFGYYTR